MTKSIESKQHIRLFQGEHVACQVQCRHGEWLNDWSACWLIWWIGLDLFCYLNPYRPKAFLTFSVILIISVHEPSMNVDCHGVQVCRNFCFSAKDKFYAENGQVEYMASNKMPLSWKFLVIWITYFQLTYLWCLFHFFKHIRYLWRRQRSSEDEEWILKIPRLWVGR